VRSGLHDVCSSTSKHSCWCASNSVGRAWGTMSSMFPLNCHLQPIVQHLNITCIIPFIITPISRQCPKTGLCAFKNSVSMTLPAVGRDLNFSLTGDTKCLHSTFYHQWQLSPKKVSPSSWFQFRRQLQDVRMVTSTYAVPRVVLEPDLQKLGG
jgi:hypothetical protein